MCPSRMAQPCCTEWSRCVLLLVESIWTVSATMLPQYLLMTDNTEKVPSNLFCEVGNEAQACAPGFFQTLAIPALSLPDFDPSSAAAAAVSAGAAAGDAGVDLATRPHACCPGYFCPAMLTCMLPCPLGAYCPRAWPADGPATYLQEDPDFSKQLVGKADKW